MRRMGPSRPRPAGLAALAACAWTLAWAAAPSAAAKLPPGFIEKAIQAQGLGDATALVIGADGNGFLAERDGRVWRLKADAVLPAPALALPVDTAGERGLLGLALDPAGPRLYAAYVVPNAGAATGGGSAALRLSGFPLDGDRADASKEAVLLNLPVPAAATSALGGGLALGPDGKLYLGVGDLMQPELAQDLTTANGKVLRLATNGFVPTDNPFYATASGQGKAAWAYGLGDPAYLSFQPGTGALLVHDVKAGGYQEIDVAVAGGNYGWPVVSGPAASDPRFKAPLYAYAATEGCSVRGGDFHLAGRARFPAEYAGDYFAADPCGGWLRRVAPATGERRDFLDGLGAPAVLRFGPQGDLYYATRGGALSRIYYAPELSITLVTQPADAAVQEGEGATFRVAVQGPLPIRYQWRKNGADIPGAKAASLTLAAATLADHGARFSVVVSNDYGSVESRAALLAVGKLQVAPRIVAQPADAAVRNGMGATFSVTADGTPPLSYRWTKRGVPIPGATSATYALQAAVLADNGADFQVEVSNAAGLVTSRRAVLTVADKGINALADVHWTTVANGRGSVESDMSNGDSDPGDGDMLSIGDRLYDRGLGTFANSEIALNLSTGCDSFYAEIGVDGERGTTGTVVFEVVADGVPLYRGPVMTAASPPVKLALSLAGRSSLRLKATDAGDQSGNDYANWADARVKCWESVALRDAARPRRAPSPGTGWYRLGGGAPDALAGSGAVLRVYDIQGRMLLERIGGRGSPPPSRAAAGRHAYRLTADPPHEPRHQERKP